MVPNFDWFDRVQEATGVLKNWTRIFNNFPLWTITKTTAGSMLDTRFSCPTSARCWNVGISRRLSCSFDQKNSSARRNSVLTKGGNFRKMLFQPPRACLRLHPCPWSSANFWDALTTGRLVTDLNYTSCFLTVFISHLKQTQEKIQHSSFMVRQQSDRVI